MNKENFDFKRMLSTLSEFIKKHIKLMLCIGIPTLVALVTATVLIIVLGGNDSEPCKVHTDDDRDLVCDVCKEAVEDTDKDDGESGEAPGDTIGDNNGSEGEGSADKPTDTNLCPHGNPKDDCTECDPEVKHEHTFSEQLSYDDAGHYYAATCEHSEERFGYEEHTDPDGNGYCDVCEYVVYYYNVSISAPQNVTVTGESKVAPGKDLIFTATVDSRYVLTADGASMMQDPTETGSTLTYTFKIESVSENSTVTISAVQKVFYKKIGTGTVRFEGLKQFSNTATVTVTVPEAGLYTVIAPTGSGVGFLTNADESGNEGFFPVYSAIHSFRADAAGEIVLSAELFLMEEPASDAFSSDFTILLDEADRFELTGTSGDGYSLPSNRDISVEFTAPEAGRFNIFTTVNGYTSCELVELEAGGSHTVLVSFYTDVYSEIGFDFSWEITKESAPLRVENGKNTISVPTLGQIAIVYNVELGGVYKFTPKSNDTYLGLWNEEYGFIEYDYASYYLADAEAGAELVLYVKTDKGSDSDSVDEVLNIEYLGVRLDSAKDETGYIPNRIDVTDLGVMAVFIVPSDGFYKFCLSDGAEISANGTDFSSEIDTEYYLEGDIIKVTVRGTGEALLYIESVIHEGNIPLGTSSIFFDAGFEYVLALPSDLIDGEEYTLSWDNDALTVYVDSRELASGESFIYSASRGSKTVICATFNGDSDTEVALWLSEVVDGELIIGKTDIYLEISDMYPESRKYIFSCPGTYTISSANADPHVTVGIESMLGYEDVTLPYTFTVGEGEDIMFVISTDITEGEGYTVSINVNADGVTAEDVLNLSSEYSAVQHTSKVYTLKFTPAYDGASYGTLTVTDHTGGGFDGTYLYAITESGVIALWNENSTRVDEFGIYYDESGKLLLEIYGPIGRLDLVPVIPEPEVPEDGDNTGDGNEGSGDVGDDGTGDDGSGNTGDDGTGDDGSGNTGDDGTGDDGSGDEGGEPIVDPVEVTYYAAIGTNSFYVDNGYFGAYALFTAPENGKYSIKITRTNGVISYNFQNYYANNTFEVLIAKGETIRLSLHTYNSQSDTVEFTISEPSAVEGNVSLGENSVTLEKSWSDKTVIFVAEKAGTYVLRAADGEDNASIGQENAYGYASLDLPYTFTLEAGGFLKIVIMSSDCSADTIDFVIEEVTEEESDSSETEV